MKKRDREFQIPPVMRKLRNVGPTVFWKLRNVDIFLRVCLEGGEKDLSLYSDPHMSRWGVNYAIWGRDIWRSKFSHQFNGI